MKRLAFMLFVAALASPALAGTEAEDRAAFADYVKTCQENLDPGQTLAECVAVQVDSNLYYLGDLLGETSDYIDKATAKRMNGVQERWEAYYKASCEYQAGMLPQEELAESLCRFRLIEARIVEVRGFNRYADPNGAD